MDKIKSYKTFENNLNPVGQDLNIEREVDKALLKIVQQKKLISMLKDTISYVSTTVDKSFPQPTQTFMDTLHDYDEEALGIVQDMRNLIMDDYPCLIDIIDDIETRFMDLENFLKNKGLMV
jgi:hypothetical protein